MVVLQEPFRLKRNISDSLESGETCNVKPINSEEFAISHYTGKITYRVKDVAQDNRDFLPPEIIDVLRMSDNSLIKMFFTNKLNKTGNITVSFDERTVKDKMSSSSSDEENAVSVLTLSQERLSKTKFSIHNSKR